jgi:hypothetical protein
VILKKELHLRRFRNVDFGLRNVDFGLWNGATALSPKQLGKKKDLPERAQFDF